MTLDFTPFFKKYEELSAMADRAFERVKTDYPNCVKCEIQCSDCCHAVFDLSLIEALYINHRFHQKFDKEANSPLMEQINKADRFIYKIRRQLRKEAIKDLEAGKDENEVMAEMAKKMAQVNLRCPMLNDRQQCDLYEFRPITCRLYGIPTSIWGKGHTCGKSGFEKGKSYPTANLDIIQKKLYDISEELVTAIKSKDMKMASAFVPLPTAILTVYDEEYLQINDENKTEDSGAIHG